MNSAAYVDQRIQELKAGGIPLSDAAFQAALLCVGWPYIFGDRGQYCTISHRQAVYNKNPSKKCYQNVRKNCQAIRENNPTGSCSGCKWYPGGNRVRGNDCRGFTYWILLQIFGWKLDGSGCTSQWNNEANWLKKGKVSEGIPQNVIVCLFYPNSKDPKVMEHTGLYFNGETVECSSGVQHSKTLNKKWTHWGVPACVNESITPVTPDPPTDTDVKLPTLRRGSKNTYVTLLQTTLLNKGYKLPKYGADGSFGAETEAAVMQFQADVGLPVDGVVGTKTWEALEKDIARKKLYTVTIQHLEQDVANELIRKYSGTMRLEE